MDLPERVLVDGEWRRWQDAAPPFWSDAGLRGLSVFEGLAAYPQPDGSLATVELSAHWDRMMRSARILGLGGMPDERTFMRHVDLACAHATVTPDSPAVYLRPTLFGELNRLGADGPRAAFVVPAFARSVGAPAGIRLVTASWQRAPDLAAASRAKAGFNYAVASVARAEAVAGGADDAILLNSEGRVAEATSASVLVALGNEVVTPPTSDGALDSITVRVVERLAVDLGIDFARRSLSRSELYAADSLAICGTGSEITPVASYDRRVCVVDFAAGPLGRLRDAYLGAVTGVTPHAALSMRTVLQLQ